MYYIANFHRGKGHRTNIIYANIYETGTDELCVSATLEYCINWISERI